MPRVAFTLLLLVLLFAAGKTAQLLLSNGDTGVIIVQTALCVVLLTGAVLCKNVRRAGAD